MIACRLLFLSFLSIVLLTNCNSKLKYNFSGINTSAKNFRVLLFKDKTDGSSGSFFEPGLSRDFTTELQEYISSASNLYLTNGKSDLMYEGEIVEYHISPQSATANATAAQNRLTMSVNVRFFNSTKEDSDFEQRFSFFFDYPGDQQLIGSLLTEAHETIFERITQDIFNRSLADW